MSQDGPHPVIRQITNGQLLLDQQQRSPQIRATNEWYEYMCTNTRVRIISKATRNTINGETRGRCSMEDITVYNGMAVCARLQPSRPDVRDALLVQLPTSSELTDARVGSRPGGVASGVSRPAGYRGVSVETDGAASSSSLRGIVWWKSLWIQ